MPLIKNRYGKGRVRVMRIHRDGDRHEVSELNVKAMIEGDFARTYTHADNSTSVSTDTIKNLVNIVARGNGKPFVELAVARGGSLTLASGIDGFAFMKSTQSGWENYVKDRYTTIPPTADRICATSMVASWKWSSKPQNYPATNAKILDTVLEVFSTTYSKSVQDSLYRMGEAALAAVPEISEISMACPNMHFILMNLSAFGLDNNNDVFLPTDEPHGQIECTVGRG